MNSKYGLICFLMIITCASSAQIYKWIDSNGVVHFSDSPHTGAVPIDIPTGQTFSPPARPVQNTTPTSGQNKSDEEHVYSKLIITQPLNEATIRNNKGYLVVNSELDPELIKGDMVQLIFDGAVVGDPQTHLSFQLNGIYRGKHTVAVEVISANGDKIVTSDVVTFFMHRPRTNMVPRPGGAP